MKSSIPSSCELTRELWCAMGGPWCSAAAPAVNAPPGDGLAFLATARGRQARTQGGSILGYIGPTEDAAWRARALPEAHCLLPGGALALDLLELMSPSAVQQRVARAGHAV